MTKFKVCFVHFPWRWRRRRPQQYKRAHTHTRTNRRRVKRWRIMHTRKTSSMSFVYEMISMHFVWIRQSCCHLIVTKFRWTDWQLEESSKWSMSVIRWMDTESINSFHLPNDLGHRHFFFLNFFWRNYFFFFFGQTRYQTKKRKYSKMTSFWRNIINDDDDVEKQTREWLESSVM